MQRVIFFGNERLSSSLVASETPLLKGLIEQGYDVAAVVVTNKPARSRKQRPLEVLKVAEANNIPLIYFETMPLLIEQLAPFEADFAVLAAFGRIIPQRLIDLFPRGIINIHPSKLPEHRGPTPIEQTILSGQTETAVSIMRLDAGMDTGPVYASTPVELTGTETKAELTTHLAEVGTATALEILPGILEGSIIPVEQADDDISYTELMTPKTGQIDWSKPAIQLEREVRAYSDWPSSKATIGSHDVTLLDVEVIDASGTPGEHFKHNKKLAVYCGESALVINQLKPAGKQAMDGTGFMNGYL